MKPGLLPGGWLSCRLPVMKTDLGPPETSNMGFSAGQFIRYVHENKDGKDTYCYVRQLFQSNIISMTNHEDYKLPDEGFVI